MTTPTLSKRVLLVEDEALIAMALDDHLREAGLDMLGPAASMRAASAILAQETPDYALLDYRLVDGAAERLAETLRARGVPFAWVTGCSRWQMPAGPEPILQKPWDPQALR